MKRKFIRISWMLALAGSMFFSFAGTSCSDDNDVEIPQPVTAVAAHTITITYDANGGSGSIEPVTISSGDKIVISDGTGLTAPAGKGFGGWSTSPDKEELDLSKLSGDITLYAVWKDILTITYDANGGTGSIEPVTFVSGWKTELSDGTGLTAPEGMVFRGWSMSKDKVEEVDFYKLNSSTTVYAVWMAKYIITYDANGGSGKISPQYFVVGDEITLADGNEFTAPKGKVFDSWSSSSNEVVSVDVASLNGDVTLYAVWKEGTVDKGFVDLTDEGFCTWSAFVDGEKTGVAGCALTVGESTGQPYGDPNVNNYIDLKGYISLEVTVSEGKPRILLNRDEPNGQAPAHLIDIPNNSDQTDKYQTIGDNQDGTTTYIIDLAKIFADYGYVHLHAIKGANWANVTVTSMILRKPVPDVDLTDEGFSTWSDFVNGEKTGVAGCALSVGESTGQPYGDPNVNNYIDLKEYKLLKVTVSEGKPRILLNRDEPNGQAPAHLIDIPNNSDQTDKYQTIGDNQDGTTTYIIDLAKIFADYGYVHLHAIKGANWANVTVQSMKLSK